MRTPGALRFRLAVAAAVVALGAVAFRTSVPYRLATRFIVVDHPLQAADFIYVLNGRIAVRAGHAARVYQLGYAPRILLAETRETSPARGDRPAATTSARIAAEIVRRGVPAPVVEIIPYTGGVNNTRDEAKALRQRLERETARRVIVVTTDHHTGRAYRTLRQELRGLRVQLIMAAAPEDRGFSKSNWWGGEQGRRIYGEELLKQLGVLFRVEQFFKGDAIHER